MERFTTSATFRTCSINCENLWEDRSGCCLFITVCCGNRWRGSPQVLACVVAHRNRIGSRTRISEISVISPAWKSSDGTATERPRARRHEPTRRDGSRGDGAEKKKTCTKKRCAVSSAPELPTDGIVRKFSAELTTEKNQLLKRHNPKLANTAEYGSG